MDLKYYETANQGLFYLANMDCKHFIIVGLRRNSDKFEINTVWPELPKSILISMLEASIEQINKEHTDGSTEG